MSDDDEFRRLAFLAVAEDVDDVIDRVIDLEGQARVAGIVEQDSEEAGRLAHLAHSVFSDVSLKALPTLVMGLADRVNVEREMVVECLEVAHGLSGSLRLLAAGSEALSGPGGTPVRVREILTDLEAFLESHPYQRVPE